MNSRSFLDSHKALVNQRIYEVKVDVNVTSPFFDHAAQGKTVIATNSDGTCIFTKGEKKRFGFGVESIGYKTLTSNHPFSVGVRDVLRAGLKKNGLGDEIIFDFIKLPDTFGFVEFTNYPGHRRLIDLVGNVLVCGREGNSITQVSCRQDTVDRFNTLPHGDRYAKQTGLLHLMMSDYTRMNNILLDAVHLPTASMLTTVARIINVLAVPADAKGLLHSDGGETTDFEMLYKVVDSVCNQTLTFDDKDFLKSVDKRKG